MTTTLSFRIKCSTERKARVASKIQLPLSLSLPRSFVAFSTSVIILYSTKHAFIISDGRHTKMKSSKYTQANGLNDNDYGGFENSTTLEETNFNEMVHYGCQNTSKDFLLTSGKPEKNANKAPLEQQEFEMVCNCALKDIVYYPKSRLKQHYSSEQDIVLANRYGFENTEFSQYSLDRKTAKRLHVIGCEQSEKVLRRNSSTNKRVQSPEIINIHRANNVLYGAENCALRSYGYDKEFSADNYGFRRGQSLRGNVSHR